MGYLTKIPTNTDFSLANIPFGIFSDESAKRLGTRIGDMVVDLQSLAAAGHFDSITERKEVFSENHLNPFIGLGKPVTNQIRKCLQDLLSPDNDSDSSVQQALIPVEDVMMHLPVKIGDYTDFYSSIEHATNVGTMFRDPNNALFPNWRHLPVGYHGRASSIIPSGVAIHRPKGQTKAEGTDPSFGPSKRVDFELEMAFIIGRSTELGESVPVQNAEDYIFGMVVFNDWSARDIQKWEYVPLGPFNGKNFASSISPWVVTMEALAPFATGGPVQVPAVLPYLQFEGHKNYDIELEVGITPEGGSETLVSRSNFKYMYWNMSQQLAHHTANGCNINIGDMMASGTISGKDPSSYGSMLELAWGGKKPLALSNGESRAFIEDGDTVRMKAFCEKVGIRIGFGEVLTTLLPAK